MIFLVPSNYSLSYPVVPPVPWPCCKVFTGIKFQFLSAGQRRLQRVRARRLGPRRQDLLLLVLQQPALRGRPVWTSGLVPGSFDRNLLERVSIPLSLNFAVLLWLDCHHVGVNKPWRCGVSVLFNCLKLTLQCVEPNAVRRSYLIVRPFVRVLVSS